MVRYTKYKKEYNKSEFSSQNSTQVEDKEGVDYIDGKVVIDLKKAFPNSTKISKNKRGFEMRQREKQSKVRKSEIVCLKCRRTGHKMSSCPLGGKEERSSGYAGSRICYKCGAKDHSLSKCPNKSITIQGQEELPFAKCFVCGKSGHLSANCEKNERGLFPKGGGCKVCGDIRHFGKDCPLKSKHKNASDGFEEGEKIFSDPEDSIKNNVSKKVSKKVKVVEFK